MQARNLHSQCRAAHVACAPVLSRSGGHQPVSVRRAAAGEPGVRTSADSSTDHLPSAYSSVDEALQSSSGLSTLESSVDEALQSSSREEALSQLGIAPVDVHQLFDPSHVTNWDPLLLAYTPFGCLLALLRMAAWIGGIALDASWFRNKAVVDAYMALLGVTVVWQGKQNIPAEVSGCVRVVSCV